MNKKHGRYGTPEWNSWHGIIQRCTNVSNKDWRHYGGRGIKVCDEWRNSFVAFFNYVGLKPSPSHSIDRFPNPAGDYEPGNVRWATKKEQRETARNLGKKARSRCLKGHPYTPENVYKLKNGYRVCLTCRRSADKAWHKNNRDIYAKSLRYSPEL